MPNLILNDKIFQLMRIKPFTSLFIKSKGYTNLLDKLIESNQIEFLFCEELLQEFIDVAKRPKFRKTISQQDLIDLLKVISQKAIFFELQSSVSVCRDLKDNYLLDL